jgi:transposase
MRMLLRPRSRMLLKGDEGGVRGQTLAACRSRRRPPRSACPTVLGSSPAGLQGIGEPCRVRRRVRVRGGAGEGRLADQASGHTEMRKGFDGLAVLVQETLKRNPHNGHLFVLRGRRSGLLKVLWHDGQGMCLFAKRLERGRCLPATAPRDDADRSVTITAAQLGYLLEGIGGVLLQLAELQLELIENRAPLRGLTELLMPQLRSA